MESVITQFLRQAEKYPDRTAVLDRRGAITYERMNRISAYLAGQIIDRLSGSRGRIALLLPRTKAFVVAQFAVLRAGCAVVPIDAEYPAERVRTILEDVGCSLCVTVDALAGKAEGFPILLVESIQPVQGNDPDGDISLDLSDPDAEGYILYTSGSTGKPKGVIHRQAMLNCAAEMLQDVIPDMAHSRALNIAGFSFIAALMDIMPMLTRGGSVYIASETERKNMDMIWKLFRKRHITGMFIPPKMYEVLLKLHGALPLKYALLGGEKYTGESAPGVWEGFGITETAAPVLLHPAGSGSEQCSGKPCRHTDVYLLDEEGNLIEKPGEVGELCVSSPWLALGYNNMPEETAQRFTDNPFKPGTRLYHSGDRMAWDEDRNLVFHGRNDRLVKVRGYRVELGEIDRVMTGRDGIEEAASVNVHVHGGDLICCYYTGEESSPDELKIYAGSFLPEYMVPEYFIHLETLPRNDRNKVDFPALKARKILKVEAEYEAPRTETEQKICEAFGEALEMESVSAKADFFECGGTSLSAAVLIDRLSEAGFTLSFQDVSAHPIPRDMANFLESKQDAGIPPMDRDFYPLTKTQMGIYLESLTGGSRETYSSPYLTRAADGIGADELIGAARQVLNAHPGMKYVIHANEDGMPCILMRPEAELDIPVFEGTEEGRLNFMQEFVPVVPMMDELLLHLAVYRTPERCYLAIKSHLIFMDGTAISLFISEMNRILAGHTPLGEDCTIQQAALYEERLMQNGFHEKAKEYYRNLFRDAEDIPALSGDLNGPLTPGVSRNLRYEPGTLTVERVKAFCEEQHISESSFFMGAMALMLGKYLNNSHVSFSTVYNGRPLAEMSHTIGTLIKRIPVYGNLSKDQPVGEFLREISRQIFTTMANDIYSFDEVLKTFPVNEDVEFIYQGDQFTDNMGTAAGESLLQGDKWFMEHYHTGMVTGCMSIQFFATNGLYNMTIEYRNEKFTEKWVQRFAQDLFTTAQGLLTAETISAISLLTNDDRSKLKSFNDTEVSIDFVPVHEQIHAHAINSPDKTAVLAAGKQLSFRELDLLSGQLAQRLINEGIKKGQLIGVLFDREVWAYVAENAVLKAGAAFLPFIPSYPDDRIAFCMKDGACPLLLTTKAQIKDRSFESDGFTVLTLEEAFCVSSTDMIRPDTKARMPELSVAPEDLAYVIYTSGSTGRPKGVMIEHRNLANYVHRNEKSVEIMHYGEPGRVNLALAAFSFDVSVVEQFVPLCNGNTAVIATETQIHDPAEFAQLIKSSGANGITCTPTYLLNLLKIPESREAIRQFTFFDIGAEAFPRQLYDRLRELREDSVILNVYGPTECTMGCAAAVMNGEEHVTVGRPIANTLFYVADPFGNELPVGMKGELIICGDQVGRGYVNLPEKTKDAFFTHNGLRAYHSGDLAAWTENGEIRIFGRIDNQIKLRGFRIELDEIEKVITEYPGISSSAATVRKMRTTEYLAGYYTAKEEINIDSLRSFLQEKLPEYMVPNVLVRLNEMPMNNNGKVDRKALPEPELKELKAEYVPPETETEKALCAAFAHALELNEKQVGLLDDFFDLGGDSLKAMLAMSMAKLKNLTAADIFQLRTPGAIAKALENKSGLETLDEREAEARLVPHPISPLQLQMIDYQLFQPKSTMWSTMHFLARFDDADADRLCTAVNRALQHHPALSTAFFFDEDTQLKQQYRPGLLPEVKVEDIDPETEDSLADTLLKPFDWILNTCLCKARVFRGRKGCYLFMDIHHVVIDGGSMCVLLGDIMNAYFDRPLQKDYYFAMMAEAEKRSKEGQYEEDFAYFHERYGKMADWCNNLKQDHENRNIDQGHSRVYRLSFNSEQVHAAEEYWGVTISVMAIAAGLLAFSIFSGEKHVIINWIFNNRLAPEAAGAVGMLIRNMPAAARMEEYTSVRELLDSVKDQVSGAIAHCGYDLMSENLSAYVNDSLEVNLQFGFGGSELDELSHEMIELRDDYAAAGARLELELFENEYGDGGFDSELDYAEGLFDKARMIKFHDLYIDIMETLMKKQAPDFNI